MSISSIRPCRGAPGRSRTRNLMGRNHLLYPVELQGPNNQTTATIQMHFGMCQTGASLVAVAQLVERRVVVPEVAGSSPVGHPCDCDVQSGTVKDQPRRCFRSRHQ